MTDMTPEEERKKRDLARTVRELCLYPYRSKGENAIRCGAWIGSWLIGIAFQSTADLKMLGGAYLIFTISLLLEFVQEGRVQPMAIVAHGAFCTLLFVMLIGSLAMIFGAAPATDHTPNLFYTFSLHGLPIMGWVLSVMMLISVILTFFEVHKLIYDEEGKAEQEIEQEREEKRDIFNQNMAGASKGGEL